MIIILKKNPLCEVILCVANHPKSKKILCVAFLNKNNNKRVSTWSMKNKNLILWNKLYQSKKYVPFLNKNNINLRLKLLNLKQQKLMIII